jgi:hypothetical protein
LTNKNNLWDLTDEQYKILTNCAKINSVVYINGNSTNIISTNILDKSFTILYINEKFNFNKENEFILLNLNEILKTIKMVGKGKIFIEKENIIITDENEDVKCKYLYGNPDIIKDISKVYESYSKIISSIKEGENVEVVEFKSDYFKTIKKFSNVNFNVLSIQNNKIVLYNNLGSTDIKIRDSIEINMENVLLKNRFDIDVSLISLIEEDDYTCYFSPIGFVLFENKTTGNIYGIASNIVD